MEPNIAKQERHGWPAQARPDRKLPEPWTPELLVGVDVLHHHALSPDGSQVAFVWQRDGNSDLWVMPLTGEQPGACWPRRLTFNRPAQAVWTDAPPRWSPDGQWLIYAAQTDIWAVPAAGGRPKRLTDYQHGDSNPVFSHDGQRVYFLIDRGESSNLCYTTLEGAWPLALTHYKGDVSDPQPSPDGKWIAFAYQPQDNLNRSQIGLLPVAGGEVRFLTGASGVQDYQPRWSPDGRQLAFISTRGDDEPVWRRLYLVDVASGDLRHLESGQGDVQSYAWAPDGQQLALIVNRQGCGDLYLLHVETGQLQSLRTAQGWHSSPQWSPDGTWLTVEFESPVQPPDLYRVDVESGAVAQLTFSTPPVLTRANLVHPQFVEYRSAGEGASPTIPALLWRPTSASATQPCPAIVYPHGGPTDEHARYWDILCPWLVAKGYAVLAPNYRGSTGYGMHHQRALHGQWGIVDTDDMLAAADYLAGLDWVDGSRLGIYGASYGSYLAVLALARDPQHRYRCGVAKYGDSDILSSWAQGDRPGREDLERQMGHPTSNRAGYRAGSPVYDVASIEAPLLIFHGDQDDRVHPKQSEQLVEALKSEGKTLEYVVYQGEGHGFLQKANLLHFHATLERFLDWYLL